MKEAFVRRLMEMAEKDPSLMVITGDLGFGMFEPFVARFPKQFLNVGIAEQNMIGVATGMALEGHLVYTYSIANFAMLRCLEQIRNDAAYHEANVKVVAMGGGFSYGALGISHHATEDITVMRSLPGVAVVVPGDEWEAAEATEAIARKPGTCYLRLDKTKAPARPSPDEKFVLGKARRIREGFDVTLIGSGGILNCALLAADELARSGIHCRIVSMHTVKPLDMNEVLAAVRETKGLITLEEHTAEGGLGGAIAERLLELGEVPQIFRRIALRAGFSSVVGSQSYLRNHYGLDEHAIKAVVADLMRKA